jgi:GTP-binding protein
MKFIDETIIDVASGNGGAGMISFRREKYKPNMGPNGGDGGRGGHVYFVASTQLQSLLDFRYNPRYHAEHGEKGGTLDCNGAGGEDLIVKVPLGTTLRDAETGEFLADLLEEGKQVLLMRGGRGGLGNMNFATPTRQAPEFAQPGEPGQQRKVKLELRLLADVSLIGFPNAGKSTLISKWSAARPKIADYPFTTLVPNLGVVRGKGQDFVLADIPGLIEGASEGRGLGLQFLKHSDRTRLLVMLLDLDPHNGRTLDEDFRVLTGEMAGFSEELRRKPKIVALSKGDIYQDGALTPTGLKDGTLPDWLVEKKYPELLALLKAEGLPKPFFISGVSGLGLEELKDAVERRLTELGPRRFENAVSQRVAMGNLELLGDELRETDEPVFADEVSAEDEGPIFGFQDLEEDGDGDSKS